MTNFKRNIHIKDVSKKNGVTLLNSNPIFDRPIQSDAEKEYRAFMVVFNNNLKLLWN